MLDRYLSRRGPLLANGLAYGLLFAFFAGVWIAISVLGLIMVGNVDWQRMLIDAVRTVIPAVSDSFLSQSVLDSVSSTLTWTSLATLAIFWWIVTGWMNSLRGAVRTMFDDGDHEPNIVVTRLRDTLAAFAVAVLFILSTAAGTVSGGLVRFVLQLTGVPRNPMLAPFAALIGVLLWFNLVAQVIMLCAALIAEWRAGAVGGAAARSSELWESASRPRS
ncbi:YhjD/YihY/BrkB family envelope integrity protein [Bifidobacterium scardovii]|uniref:YhjD/YihY/BrkB family envelope integrity protein n=1 Tax=Bifidobacterium scardovii TaxID=158787 RepID=UPI0013767352|nr:YhjD/YihY/BrkB family envelope integrity protein [Bifidobacterium scardovii]MDU8980693.1 YhjD/YihY/BrkB family envelope integrity protein [Bifidobacterium scardovii]